MLPQMVRGPGRKRIDMNVFKGMNRSEAAHDGEIYTMKNMSSDKFPLLCPRKERKLMYTLTAPGGMHADDNLYYADGTGFYSNGVLKGTVTAGRKTFCTIGDYVIILPDKKYYDRTGNTFGSLEETYVSGAGEITFSDGTYAGVTAEANTIVTTGTAFAFKAGDNVTISGSTNNNKTAIIREISDDKKTLRFYELTFDIEGTTFTELGAVTLKRAVPDMNYILENDNRLWGCGSDTLYACKLGDPFNWMNYDNLSTASYYADVGSPGDFTGCAVYLGYPMFFKEDIVYKIYGEKPSNFEIIPIFTTGCEKDSGRSFTLGNETLFYLSRNGVTAYGGGSPAIISEPLNARFTGAAAGSDGSKLYISMKDSEYGLYVYDTRYGTWHREDAIQATDFVSFGGKLYMLTLGGEIWEIDGGGEGIIESETEFGDFYEATPDAKYMARMLARCEVDEGASLTFYLSYDGDTWEEAGEITAGDKRMKLLPMIPRRADRIRLKIAGTGNYTIYGLTREYTTGNRERRK